MQKRILLLISLITFVSLSASAQTLPPESTVTAFYKFDHSHSRTFDRQNIDLRKQWFSPRLYGLFIDELRKQTAFLKTHPGAKPYFGDGIPFSPIDEPCDADGGSISREYSVQNASSARRSAFVPVRFYYPKPCTLEAVTWRVKLVRTSSGWAIDDLLYDNGTSLASEMKAHSY